MFKNRKIICLCGSNRFEEAFKKANKEESAKGHIVVTIANLNSSGYLNVQITDKKEADQLQLDKVELADEILVLNVGGHIGSFTKKSIQHAIKHNKIIRYLENY